MNTRAMSTVVPSHPAPFVAARHLTRSLRSVPRSGRDAESLVVLARSLVELARAIAAGQVDRWDPNGTDPGFPALRPGVGDNQVGILEEFLKLLLHAVQRPGRHGHEYAVQLAIIAEEMFERIDEPCSAATLIVARADTVGDPVDSILQRWGMDRYSVAAETGLGQFYIWDTHGRLPLAPVSTDIVADTWLRQLKHRHLMSPAHILARPASWLGRWRPGLLEDLGLLRVGSGANEAARVLMQDGWGGSVADLLRAARNL